MKRQREQFYIGEPAELRSNHINDQMLEYVQFLRQQIRQLGTQIDFEFERASELIFSLYKHLYSPTQCPGEKATLLNKLSGFGVQWNLQSQFEAKPQEVEVRSEEGRSINMGYNDTKDIENNKKAYNMRIKTKPQKYRVEDQYDYVEKNNARLEGGRRGRPASRRENQVEQKRVEQPNPYEKAPYKKRKAYIGDAEPGKEESPLRQEPGRSSAKWQSQDQKDEIPGIDSNKNIQPDFGQGNELEKHGNEGENIGRQEGGFSSINNEQIELQGKIKDSGPSQLVVLYGKYIRNPRLIMQLASQND